MNIRTMKTLDIANKLYWHDDYYETVAMEYIVDAVREALYESNAATLEQLNQYIKHYLI